MDLNHLLAYFVLDHYKKQDDEDMKQNQQIKEKLGVDMEVLENIAD